MPVLRLKKFVVLVLAFIILPTAFVLAGNPATPILPSDNIQDPGDPGTAWGGCGPSDSNCYVTVTNWSFSNGLTNTSGTVRLGGNLTQNTAIDGQNQYSFDLDQLSAYNVDVTNNLGNTMTELQMFNGGFYLGAYQASGIDEISLDINPGSFYLFNDNDVDGNTDLYSWISGGNQVGGWDLYGQLSSAFMRIKTSTTTSNSSYQFTNVGTSAYSNNFLIDQTGFELSSKPVSSGGTLRGIKIDLNGNVGINNNTPLYRLDVLNNITSQTTSNRVANFSNAGATFNTTAGPLSSYGGYFSSTSTRSAGANTLTNIGLYATASGAQNNYAAIFNGGGVSVGLPVDSGYDFQITDGSRIKVGFDLLNKDYYIGDTNEMYLHIDEVSLEAIGDINTTRFSLEDSTQLVTFSGFTDYDISTPNYTGNVFEIRDNGAGALNMVLGDVSAGANNTKITIDDLSHNIILNTNHAGGVGTRAYLDIASSNQYPEIYLQSKLNDNSAYSKIYQNIDGSSYSILDLETFDSGGSSQLSLSGGSILASTTTMTINSDTTTGTALDVSPYALTTGMGLSMSSSTLSSGSLVNLSVASTAAVSNTQKVLNITTSGVNATSTQTTYGAYLSNTHTGTSSTNVGLYVTASGGTNNYAAIFEGGNVGIGTTTPAAALDVIKTTEQVRIGYDSSKYFTTTVGSSGTVMYELSQATASWYWRNGIGSQSLFIGGSADGYQALLRSTDGDAGADLTLRGDLLGSQVYFNLSADDDTNPVVGITGDAINQQLSFDAAKYIFNGNIGIGDVSPASLLTVGLGDLFQVNSSGAIAAATGIVSSGTIQFSALTTNGALYTSGGNGTLTTTAPTSGTIGYWSRSGTTLSPATANDLVSISTNSTTASNKALEVLQTGATTGTDYAGYFSNTGAATTNTGLYTIASGASTNYALYAVSPGGASDLAAFFDSSAGTSPSVQIQNETATGIAGVGFNVGGGYWAVGKYGTGFSGDRSGSFVITQTPIFANGVDALRINSSREVFIGGSTTDAGAYILQVAGNYYQTSGTHISANTGNALYLHNGGGVGYSLMLAPDYSYDPYVVFGYKQGADPLSGSYTNFLTVGSAEYNIKANGGQTFKLLTNSGTERLTAYQSTELVINETGASYDFRIEGDTDANLFLADASTDRIGIGDNTPAALLTVGSGDLFQVNSSGNILGVFANATTDTDRFLVSDSGTIKYRTGTELRSDIGAAGVSGTPVANQIAFWDSSGTVKGSTAFTVSDALYPSLTVGSSANAEGTIAIIDLADTYVNFGASSGGATMYGSSTYRGNTFYSYAGGNLFAQFLDSAGVLTHDFKGRISTNTLQTGGSNLGAFNIDRTFAEASSGNNQHGYVDKTVFRYGGSAAFNAFYAENTIGATNAGYTQDHWAGFQTRITKDGANTVNNLYDFVALGSLINGGTTTNRYGFYMFTANNGGGGTLTNQYGIYIPSLTGATNSWTLYSVDAPSYHGGEFRIGSATDLGTYALQVTGNAIVNSGTLTVPGAGTNSERFGAGTLAAGNNSLAVGNGASAPYADSVAIGYLATLTNAAGDGSSTAIGRSASAGFGGVAIGYGATTTGNQNIAIGIGATSTAPYQSVALGRNASASGASGGSTAIGDASSAGTNGTALGGSAIGSGYSVALGVGANTGTVTSNLFNIAIGQGASASTFTPTIVIGTADAIATANNQLVIGSPSYPMTTAYLGGGVVRTSASDIVLNATGGSGTDIAGSNFSIAGGKGTGNAAGGYISFLTSNAGSSGTTLQSLTEKARFNVSGELQIGSTTDLGTYALQVTGDIRSTQSLSIGSSSEEVKLYPSGGDIYLDKLTGGGSSFIYRESASEAFRIQNNVGVNIQAGLVVNESGGNFDTRIEGDTDTNLFFLDASADEIIITKTAGAALTDDAFDITYTAGAGNGSDLYSALKINATSANHSATTDKLYGINIDNLSSADAEGEEIGIRVGTSWQYAAIFESGNVGIGTATPDAPLDIIGNEGTSFNPMIEVANTDTDGYTQIGFVGTGNTWSIGVGNNTETAQSIADDFFIYDFDQTAIRFVIDTTGEVGIGDNTPDYLLDVANTGTDGNIFALTDSDGECLYNPESGAVTVTCSSDERLKENIIDAPSALDYFRPFKIREYNVKASGDKMIGVIAQEVLLTNPELVTVGVNEMYSVQLPSQWQVVKGLQELDLKILDIESFDANSSFVNRMKEWLGDVANGIGRIFAKELKTEKLCITDGGGELCVTKADLQNILNQNQGGSGGGSTPTPPTDQGNGEPQGGDGQTEGEVPPTEGGNPEVPPEIPTEGGVEGGGTNEI